MADQNEIQRVLGELSVSLTNPVKKSTKEYYLNNKEKSYKIEPSHQYRGRALVIIMTAASPEWEKEAKAINEMLHALYIKPEFKFDPSSRELFMLLQRFAEDKINSDADCTFITIVGHGHKEENKWFLYTKPHKCEIWTICTQLFAHSFESKPKIFFIKLSDENLEAVQRGSELPEPVMNDYIMYITTTSEKDSSPVKNFSTVVSDKAHNSDIETVFQKVDMTFKSFTEKINQIWSSTSHLINVFPGIGDENKKDSGEIKLKGASVKKDTPDKEKGIPPSDASGSSENTVSSKTPEEQIERIVKPKSTQIRITASANDEINRKNAEEQLLLHVSKEKNKQELEKTLSNNLDTDITIEDIEEGSVILTIRLKDGSKLSHLKYLSDSNYLSNLMDCYLVTDEYLSNCQVQDIHLTAVLVLEESSDYWLDETAYLKMKAEDRTGFLGENIELNTKYVHKETTWYFSQNEEHPNNLLGRLPQLKLRDISRSNQGYYTCVSTAESGAKFKSVTRLYVTDFGLPEHIAAYPVNPYSVHITWERAPGNVTGYKIYCPMTGKKGPVIPAEASEEAKSAVVTGLKPNTHYRVYVVSVSEDSESKEMPPGGIWVETPDMHHVILATCLDDLRTKLNLESILDKMKESVIINEGLMTIKWNGSEISNKSKFIEWLKFQPKYTYTFFLQLLFNTNQDDIVQILKKTRIDLKISEEDYKLYETKEAFLESAHSELSSLSGIGDDEKSLHSPRFEQYFSNVPSDRMSAYLNQLREEQFAASLDSANTNKFSKDSGMLASRTASTSSTTILEGVTDSETLASTSATPSTAVSEDCFAVVLYAHTPRDDDELELNVKDIITVKEQDDTGWWRGEINGNEGLFPSHCVQLLNLINPPSANQSESERTESPKKAVVISNFMSYKADELDLNKGDIVVVLEERTDGFIMGYSRRKLGLLPGRYIKDLDFNENTLIIEFKDDDLMIYKRGETGSMAVLTEKRWNKECMGINAEAIKAININLVIIECPKTVSEFISRCKNCEKMVLQNYVPDTSSAATNFTKGIAKLEKLTSMEITDTVLGKGWATLMNQISSPCIRVLSLHRTDMAGCGDTFENFLNRTTELKVLNLANSGLGGEELVRALTHLPQTSPGLVGLFVNGHDLSKSTNKFITVIENLPHLKVLDIGHCNLKSSRLMKILEKANKKLEVLSITQEQTKKKVKSIFVSTFAEFRHMKYLHVSSFQFRPTDMELLTKQLASLQGHLVINDDTDASVVESYQIHVNTIMQECQQD